MPLNTDVLGAKLPSLKTVISTRAMQAFAAGIGDCGPLTLDDSNPDFMASPAMIVVPEWQLALKLFADSSLGLSPGERAMGLHVGQDTLFHRRVTAGMELLLEATVITVKHTAAGALSCSRVESREVSSGDAVSTSYLTTIYRGVAVTGEGGTTSPYMPVTCSPPTADTNVARIAGTMAEQAVSELALEIFGPDALEYGSFADSHFRLAMTAGVAVGAAGAVARRPVDRDQLRAARQPGILQRHAG